MEESDEHPAAAAWTEVLEDMDATAATYVEDGWEVQKIHPGQVTVRDGEISDRLGLDVLVPDNEFAAVEELLEAGFEVDDYEVFTAIDEGFVLLLLVLRDRQGQRAVFVPTYYRIAGRSTYRMLSKANERGMIHTYLRTLDETVIEFTHEDPELFQPPESVE